MSRKHNTPTNIRRVINLMLWSRSELFFGWERDWKRIAVNINGSFDYLRSFSLPVPVSSAKSMFYVACFLLKRWIQMMSRLMKLGPLSWRGAGLNCDKETKLMALFGNFGQPEFKKKHTIRFSKKSRQYYCRVTVLSSILLFDSLH